MQNMYTVCNEYFLVNTENVFRSDMRYSRYKTVADPLLTTECSRCPFTCQAVKCACLHQRCANTCKCITGTLCWEVKSDQDLIWPWKLLSPVLSLWQCHVNGMPLVEAPLRGQHEWFPSSRRALSCDLVEEQD